MPTRVFEAIVTRWDAQSLADTFKGEIWFDEQPAGRDNPFPFVRMSSLGGSSDFWTTDSEFQQQLIQLKIFYRKVDGTNPLAAVGALMRTLHTAMDFAPLSIPSSEGHVLLMEPIRFDVKREPDPDIWSGVIDYMVKRRKAANYSPG